MTIALVFIPIGIIALAFIGLLASGRAASAGNIEHLAEQLRAVDVKAFRNLIDPDEEQYLRANLPAADFRKVQRERVFAAIEYVSCAAQNAAILTRLGDAARRSANPSTAEAGAKLVDTAVRVRLYALHATAKLYLGLILPNQSISPAPITEGYEQMTRLVVLLGVFQRTPQGVAAAL